MGLEIADVRRVLSAFEEAGWDEIHLSAPGFELHLVADGAQASAPLPAATALPTPVATPVETPLPPSTPTTPPADGVDRIEVCSPSVGTFYRSPSPGAPPFVSEGDRVEPGATVCIVEVMKLMNNIVADVAGTVTAVFPANAEHVEFGTPLVAIRPDA